jgi:hypothetical protein
VPGNGPEPKPRAALIERCLASCQNRPIPSDGQITGTDNGVEGSWFIELNDAGSPVSKLPFIRIEAMSDVVPG